SIDTGAGNPVQLGNDSNGRNLLGDLDEVRISSVARSSNWIWAVWMNSGSNVAFNCYSSVTTGAVDLAIGKSVDAINLLAGTNLTYTLIVSNLGVASAGGVVVTDALPADVRFVSSLPAPDGMSPGFITWSLGTIDAGSRTTIVVQTSVDTGAVNALTNFGFVVSADDTNEANNMAFAVTALPDNDNDGLRDFVDPDDDNDGVSDEEEEIADTDPFDAGSFLRLQISRTTTNGVQRVEFPTSSNRNYFLQNKTNLMSDPWMTVLTNIPGSGGLISIPRTSAVERIYFRVGVERP
ncbi:MAG: hypothetical protein AAF492_09350, partial [Verrucomicrobiota bacterium]